MLQILAAANYMWKFKRWLVFYLLKHLLLAMYEGDISPWNCIHYFMLICWWYTLDTSVKSCTWAMLWSAVSWQTHIAFSSEKQEGKKKGGWFWLPTASKWLATVWMHSRIKKSFYFGEAYGRHVSTILRITEETKGSARGGSWAKLGTMVKRDTLQLK